MTTWRVLCFALSLAFFAYLCRASLASAAYRVYQWGAALFASRSAGGSTVVPPPPGVSVTAEQAQAAELILSRFVAKADRSDATYKLIANGITTLAQEVAPKPEKAA